MFGLLIHSLYWGIGDKEDTNSIASTSALLYFISALCGYGAAAFVPSLTLDRPLFYRELADGCYSPLVYYLSKFFEEALLCIATTLLFSAIVFFGVRLQGNFWIFVVNYYLTTMTGICLAYAVAALVPTMDAANALLPTYVTTCLYFGGLFITFFGCQLQGSFWVFASVYYLTTMCGICLAYAVAAIAPNMEAANALLPTYVTICMYFGGLFLLFDKIPDGWVWASWTSFSATRGERRCSTSTATPRRGR